MQPEQRVLQDSLAQPDLQELLDLVVLLVHQEQPVLVAQLVRQVQLDQVLRVLLEILDLQVQQVPLDQQLLVRLDLLVRLV